MPKHAQAHVQMRIEHIADMMRTLRFRRGETIRELAKKWNLSIVRTKELSAEASKIVHAEVMDPERVTIVVTTALERVLFDALADDDRASVISAAKTWAQITGATAPTRVSHTLETLSDEELERRYVSALARGQKDDDAERSKSS